MPAGELAAFSRGVPRDRRYLSDCGTFFPLHVLDGLTSLFSPSRRPPWSIYHLLYLSKRIARWPMATSNAASSFKASWRGLVRTIARRGGSSSANCFELYLWRRCTDGTVYYGRITQDSWDFSWKRSESLKYRFNFGSFLYPASLITRINVNDSGKPAGITFRKLASENEWARCIIHWKWERVKSISSVESISLSAITRQLVDNTCKGQTVSATIESPT